MVSLQLGLRFDRGSSLVVNQEQVLKSDLDAIVADLITVRLGTVYEQQALPLHTFLQMFIL